MNDSPASHHVLLWEDKGKSMHDACTVAAVVGEKVYPG